MKIKALFFIILIHWQQITLSVPPTAESLTGREQEQPPRRRRDFFARIGTALLHGITLGCIHRAGDVDASNWEVVVHPKERARAAIATSKAVLAKVRESPDGQVEAQPEEDLLVVLERERENLFSYTTRAISTFADDYCETLQINFSLFPDFDPKNVYRYLGCENDKAAEKKYLWFQKLTEQRKQAAIEDGNEKEERFMRQCDFIFRNEFTKQVYDAYLKGGHDSVAALQIDPDAIDHFQILMVESTEAKAELEEHRRQVAKAAACQDEAATNKKQPRRKKRGCEIC